MKEIYSEKMIEVFPEKSDEETRIGLGRSFRGIPGFWSHGCYFEAKRTTPPGGIARIWDNGYRYFYRIPEH